MLTKIVGNDLYRFQSALVISTLFILLVYLLLAYFAFSETKHARSPLSIPHPPSLSCPFTENIKPISHLISTENKDFYQLKNHHGVVAAAVS